MATEQSIQPVESVLTDRVKRRFWAKVQMAGREACWLWIGAKIPEGYGVLHFGTKRRKRLLLAHRVSVEIETGLKVSDDLCVLHKCDVPACVNPSHLFIGTRIENNKDRHAKGRSGAAYGERNGMRLHPGSVVRGEKASFSKLTDSSVIDIRARWPAESSIKLGLEYGVTSTQILRVAHGKSWAHVASPCATVEQMTKATA